LLEYAPPAARRVCVYDLPGRHPERAPQVQQLMIDAARQGQCVVRLKGGDPFVFGRGAEEAEALRQAGVSYEIVPGVTAALAAAACADIPLTHRAHSSAIALVTGHEDPYKSESNLDWGTLAHFSGTLAIYMGVTQLGHITLGLLDGGMSPDMPAALVYRASTGEQKTVTAPLGRLEERVRAAGLGRPSLVLLGPAVALKSSVSWFEARPLLGLRIVVTRPRAQAIAFIRQLELLGAVPMQV